MPNCDFTTPKTFDGSAPATSTEFWQYSQAVCTSTQVELIQNAETGAEFYIDKTITYGDFILFSFLMVALIFGIVGFLIKFLIPKLINFKK